MVENAREAKLTPYYSLIAVTLAVNPVRICQQYAGLFRLFMDYKASVSQQWHFLVFWEIHCTLTSELLNRK